MTNAEFRILRDRLGLTMEWVSEQLGVAERTVRRWEAGSSSIPVGVATDMQAIAESTESFVDEVVATLRGEEPDGDGLLWVLAYATEASYRAEHPDSPWTAAWHRAAMGQVAQTLPAVRVHYVDGGGGGQ